MYESRLSLGGANPAALAIGGYVRVDPDHDADADADIGAAARSAWTSEGRSPAPDPAGSGTSLHVEPAGTHDLARLPLDRRGPFEAAGIHQTLAFRHRHIQFFHVVIYIMW